jgi:PAS domain S-box-containing protein
MPHTIVKILIVDDDEEDYFITSEYIKHIAFRKIMVQWCPTYTMALQLMLDKAFDLYLVDYRLGAKTGIDLLKEALNAGCNEPIILLTGKGNYEVDIEAMKLGAVDYFVKTEMNLESIERSIRYALERSETLKALKAGERKYRGIFENLKDIIFIANTQWVITDINPAIFSVLAFQPNEVIGRSLFDFMEGFEHTNSKNYFLDLPKPIHDLELNFIAASGQSITCLLNLDEQISDDGTPFLQGILHDISSLKNVAKVKLQTEKLAAASRLVRTLAHEVRNPLTNIILAADQLRNDKKEDQGLVYLDMINRNSKRINDLITMLLDTSAPAEMRMSKTSVSQIIYGLLHSTQDSLNLSGIHLSYNVPSTELFINADADKIQLALKNIIVNAIEAMEHGNGKLQIVVSSSSRQIQITITDNGIGIPPENISRLFEPYFTQKRNGLGLGLTLTLNILQAHSATVDVRSKLGKGTSFLINFPKYV